MFQMPLDAFTQDESFPFFIQYGEHKEPLFLHSHDHFSELVIVLQGSATHIVDGEWFHIEKGDVFVIGENTEHGYTDTENFHICNIMFRQSFLSLNELDIAESPGFQALFILEPHCSRNRHFSSRLKLRIQEFMDINSMIEQLYQEYTNRVSGWKTMVKSEFLRLAVALSRWYSFEDITDETGIIKLAGAIAHIEKYYTDPLSISELAKLSNYSERQFVRIFKDTLGCVPMKYIAKLRMQKARELLQKSDLAIAEVAAQCGYHDSNYFSRIFKHYNAVTPSAYRKKMTLTYANR